MPGEIVQRCRALLSNNKKALLQWAYVVSGVLTIVIPFSIRDRTDDSKWYDCRVFHKDFYAPLFQWGSVENRVYLSYHNHQIWELYAILQAMLLSIIIIWSLEERQMGVKTPVLISTLILASCVASMVFLGIGKDTAIFYLYSCMWMVTLFFVEDLVCYRKSREPRSAAGALEEEKFKRLCIYVDVPIMIATGTLTGYVLLQEGSYSEFYGGAIAFQLIVGNILIFIIGLHTDMSEPGGIKGALRRNFCPTFESTKS